MSAQPIDFTTLFEERFDGVCRWLYAMGVPDSEIEDVAQETFWRVQRLLSRFDGANLDGWLYRIVSRQASDHRKSRWFKHLFRRRAPLPDDTVPARGHRPDEALEEVESRALVGRVVEQLSPKLRVVFVMVEIDGLSVEEVARLEGVASATMRSRLRLAREAFHRLMRKLEPPVDRTPAREPDCAPAAQVLARKVSR